MNYWEWFILFFLKKGEKNVLTKQIKTSLAFTLNAPFFLFKAIILSPSLA
jgi:hypothetical protein